MCKSTYVFKLLYTITQIILSIRNNITQSFKKRTKLRNMLPTNTVIIKIRPCILLNSINQTPLKPT